MKKIAITMGATYLATLGVANICRRMENIWELIIISSSAFMFFFVFLGVYLIYNDLVKEKVHSKEWIVILVIDIIFAGMGIFLFVAYLYR